ncbi:MAG TPA: class I SAM-dependent methyltransferase [Nocardioides sp.]|nr:class I SAM-dependent methyltransferase [Nocardioides sp.]
MTATMPAGEVFSHALRGETCYLSTPDRQRLRLPVADWTRATDGSDDLLLQACLGATLDIGCGPGRMVAELAARGHVTLGIDVVGEAVRQTVDRGAAALMRDVFARVPGEGRWETALLADGNIGIGGDPAALLARARRLLHPGGRVVVEVAGPGERSAHFDARLECACGHSERFPWAVVSIDALPALADAAGLVEIDRLTAHGRWVGVLTEAA